MLESRVRCCSVVVAAFVAVELVPGQQCPLEVLMLVVGPIEVQKPEMGCCQLMYWIPLVLPNLDVNRARLLNLR